MLSRLFAVAAAVTSMASAQQGTSVISEFNRYLLAKQKLVDPYQNDPRAASAEAPSPPAEPQKLSARVAFLTDGRTTVIVPKGAVIHIPKNGRISPSDRIVGQIVEWDAFFHANRNAIRLEPVSKSHLQGTESLTAEAMERIAKAGFLTLSAYQNRVVSLPAAPAENTPPSTP